MKRIALLIITTLILSNCADNRPRPWWLKGGKHYYNPLF